MPGRQSSTRHDRRNAVNSSQNTSIGQRLRQGDAILFACVGNACRSQMAEGFGRKYAPAGVDVLSGGMAPKGLDPRAVEAMKELGIDITGQHSKAIKDLPDADLRRVRLVVTLCGDPDEACPVLPGEFEHIHWPLPDPAAATGSADEVRKVFRDVRDEVQRRIGELFGTSGGGRDR